MELQRVVYKTWVNAIKKAMADKINEYFSPYMGKVNIHTEEMEQGFERPAFFILMGYISTDKLMNRNYLYSYSMRVRYHADDKEDTRFAESEYDELSAVGEILTEALREILLPVGGIDNVDKLIVRETNTNFAPSENKKVLIFQTTYQLTLSEQQHIDLIRSLEADVYVKDYVNEKGEN